MGIEDIARAGIQAAGTLAVTGIAANTINNSVKGLQGTKTKNVTKMYGMKKHGMKKHGMKNHSNMGKLGRIKF